MYCASIARLPFKDVELPPPESHRKHQQIQDNLKSSGRRAVPPKQCAGLSDAGHDLLEQCLQYKAANSPHEPFLDTIFQALLE